MNNQYMKLLTYSRTTVTPTLNFNTIFNFSEEKKFTRKLISLLSPPLSPQDTKNPTFSKKNHMKTYFPTFTPSFTSAQKTNFFKKNSHENLFPYFHPLKKFKTRKLISLTFTPSFTSNDNLCSYLHLLVKPAGVTSHRGM